MQHLPPPKSLEITDGNKRDSWTKFRQNFELCMVATGGNKKEDPIQRAVFLHLIGDEGREIYSTFLDITSTTKLTELLEKFENYFVGKSNSSFERHLFREIKQNGRSFDLFLQELRTRSKKCDFGDRLEQNMCDQIIEGISNKRLKEKLLSEETVTVENFISKCRAHENVMQQLEKIEPNETETVDSLRKKYGQRSKSSHIHKERGYGIGQSSKRNMNGTSSSGGLSSRSATRPPTDRHHLSRNQRWINNCTRCGNCHAINQCPAYGKECQHCHKLGHFRKMCRSRLHEARSTSLPRRVNEFQAVPNNDCDEIYVGSLDAVNKTDNKEKCTKKWIVSANVGCKKVPVKFKLDTGAEVSTLPLSLYRQITNKKLNEPKKKLTAYNNQEIRVVGEIKLPVYVNEKHGVVNFSVVDEKCVPLLGLEACVDMDLVQR